jgi:hypothetical protein
MIQRGRSRWFLPPMTNQSAMSNGGIDKQSIIRPRSQPSMAAING